MALPRRRPPSSQVFDAAGFDIIIIETVGAGQSEVEMARLAHTTLVVEAPGMGDDIQAIKAGILEIADILVVNKADRPGVENTERALRSTLELAHPTKRISHHGRLMEVGSPPETQGNKLMWIPPILKTVSTEGKGFGELAEAIARHVQYLHQSGDWAARDRARLEAELESALRETLIQRFLENVQKNKYEETVQRVLDRDISPYEAINALLDGASNRTT